ncbi:MAG: hypothetical protein D6755_03020 [Anaerolineae bacterium]|nr:MAG: hypothetical protein D6755_03020 [Anaerolineae bacterium]
MQLRPYLSSVTISAAVNIVWSVITTAATILFLGKNFEAIMANPDAIPPDQAAGMVTGGLIMACLSLLIGLLVYGGGGFFYAYRYRQEATLTTEAGMLGGAAVGASVFVISRLAGYLVSFIAAPLTQNIIPPNAVPSNGIPGMDPGSMMAFGVAFSILGLCIGLVISALVGLVGGLVGSLTLKETA